MMAGPHGNFGAGTLERAPPPMSDRSEKGGFQADIPEDAVAAALRSVERNARTAAGSEDGAAEEPGVTLEVGAREPGLEPGDPALAALEAELASVKAQLEESLARGRDSHAKFVDAHDRHVRAVADLDNYRKRAQREREDVQKFGVEKLVKDLLPVVDDLDRALAAAPPEGGALAQGVKLVRASLERALARHGVQAFSALGAPFDPARHEALMQVPTADAAPGTVVLEHARGFTLSDRLVRPAMVGVAVAPPAPPADGAASGGGGGGEA